MTPMPRASAELLHREQAAPGHYLLQLRCAEIAKAASPGQFVHLRVSDGLEPLLRRPFSIMRTEPAQERLWLLVHVVGRGTGLIAAHDEGTRYDLLGPLGRGWALPQAGENVLLVAGGVPGLRRARGKGRGGICAGVHGGPGIRYHGDRLG